MTKQALQDALQVEYAVHAAIENRHDTDGRKKELLFLSQDRIEAIYHAAATRGWALEI